MATNHKTHRVPARKKARRNDQGHRDDPATQPADLLSRPLVTTEALAHALEMHNESVRRLCREGRIKARKYGPFWRVPRAEVERIMATGL